jgi:TPR repeat protein
MRPDSIISRQVGSADASVPTQTTQADSSSAASTRGDAPHLFAKSTDSAKAPHQPPGSAAPSSRDSDSDGLNAIYAEPSSAPQTSVRSTSVAAVTKTSEGKALVEVRADTVITEKPLALWLQEAMEGDAEAQAHIGLLYERGDAVEGSFLKAAHWYGKAAAQGHRDAQRLMGTFHLHGLGVSQDEKQAADWFHEAARRGDNEAQFQLGNMYRLGQGKEKNNKKAFFWFKQAANGGNRYAAHAMAEMLVRGLGAQKNLKSAFDIFSELASLGHASAQISLAKMYHKGIFVEQNFTKAAMFYRQAAEQGDPLAQFHLSCMYEDGEGVEQDFTQAMHWALLFGRKGIRDVRKTELSDSGNDKLIQCLPLVLQKFREFSELSKLKLTNFRCSEAGISALERVIQSSGNITSMSIGFAEKVDGQAAIALAERLLSSLRRSNTTLIELNFVNKPLPADTQLLLDEALQQNRNIKELRDYIWNYPPVTGKALPTELQLLVADQLIVQSIKQGLGKEAVRAAVDEFFMSA